MDTHLKNFLTYLNVERGFSPNTISSYATQLSRFVAYTNQRSIHHPSLIDHEILDDFLLYLKDHKVGHNTQRLFIYALRSFLKFLVLDEVIKSNFLQYTHIPKVQPTKWALLTADEIDSLFSQIDTTIASQACYKAILEFLYGSGVRVSEACALKIKDIHHDFAKVMGKGRKEYMVPLSAVFLESLHHYWSHFRHPDTLTPEDYVFLRGDNTPIKRIQINIALKKYAKLAQITKKVTPHILRHCFASHLITRGVSFQMVQEFLGHSQIETTGKYTHLNEEDVIESFKKFHPRYE